MGMVVIARHPRSKAEEKKQGASSALSWSVVYPDVDNSCKLYSDGLTRRSCESGLAPWCQDDARFSLALLVKVRTSRLEQPRVDLLVWKLSQSPDPLLLAGAIVSATQ